MTPLPTKWAAVYLETAADRSQLPEYSPRARARRLLSAWAARRDNGVRGACRRDQRNPDGRPRERWRTGFGPTHPV